MPNEVAALTLPVVGGAPPPAVALGDTLPRPAPTVDWPDGLPGTVLPPCTPLDVLPPCIPLENARLLFMLAFEVKPPNGWLPDGLTTPRAPLVETKDPPNTPGGG